jgi:putative transposase
MDSRAHNEQPKNWSKYGRLSMQPFQRHLVRTDHPQYASIDAAAFASKNLYNQANYQIRQAFIHEGTYLPYAEIFHCIKHMECYQALPAKVANSILMLLHKNWLAFFAAREAYQADPSLFTGRPRQPKYSGPGEGAQHPHL